MSRHESSRSQSCDELKAPEHPSFQCCVFAVAGPLHDDECLRLSLADEVRNNVWLRKRSGLTRRSNSHGQTSVGHGTAEMPTDHKPNTAANDGLFHHIGAAGKQVPNPFHSF